MERLERDGLTITWLNGGVTHMDGGAMFGVVPKPLWSRKYPHNDKNQIELRTDPMLIEKDGKRILVEAGIGNERLDEKQRRNYGVLEESSVEQNLAKLGLAPSDIDIVLMTHLHFDHASGLVKKVNGADTSLFENAVIYTSEIEWKEMNNPNIRSKNTYWQQNRIAITDQIKTFTDEVEVIPGIRLVHTGGHSDGHSILLIEHEGESFIHLADIMPTHAHANVLWVLAYDDYPMTSIKEKEKWMNYAKQENASFLFYHDYKYRMIKWNEQGEIISSIERTPYSY
ncbi:YtnP family quorum-quenching lactonase [Halalkalibacter akibai]|uniref:Metallo-beta-lactamase family protein n=1 Tax=Halalkalibacter akibai (strain ATCC 43226 / DSM 21942 / CIP 109018 / JCM 9157 / 1139) TaxID=1236973 RepID=W4QQJ1_HALA3|nr:MBL fold metallo-hydrolase [Halalkalibacter akibai]GAE34192.1 metallo-beta-lactamase family protein [Halalkalibacter akibai JCM 9157]